MEPRDSSSKKDDNMKIAAVVAGVLIVACIVIIVVTMRSLNKYKDFVKSKALGAEFDTYSSSQVVETTTTT